MNLATNAGDAWLADYENLVARAALVDLGHRTQIELTDADRASFLHNLCTNDVRGLAPGKGCEAFLTNVQGKTIGHIFAFAGPESIVISTVPDQGEKIMAHLDHYLVSERVSLSDRSDEWIELYLGGPQSSAVVAHAIDAEPPRERLAHTAATIDGRDAWIRRVELTSPDGYLIAATREDAEAISAAVQKHGAATASHEAFEAARIEHRFPLFARDITDKNLPQEIGRDSLAISFKKGCYLGQETVARIDALGHVNQSLVAVKFDGASIPTAGTVLSSDGQAIGHVTSATFSPSLGQPLALAYVRRGHNAGGTRLESPVGAAEILTSPA